METKRIFISITLPEEIKDYLRHIQRPEIRWIKWLKPENFHITLNFLGDLRDSEIEQVKQILSQTTSCYHPFQLSLSKIRQERDMLWIMSENHETLSNLQAELLNKFHEANLGKPERRRYVAHILLAKSRNCRPMTWQPENFEPQEFEVNAINLYESRLTPDAATHILIQSFAFENSKSQAPNPK